jgi:hypothetical protein
VTTFNPLMCRYLASPVYVPLMPKRIEAFKEDYWTRTAYEAWHAEQDLNGNGLQLGHVPCYENNVLEET